MPLNIDNRHIQNIRVDIDSNVPDSLCFSINESVQNGFLPPIVFSSNVSYRSLKLKPPPHQSPAEMGQSCKTSSYCFQSSLFVSLLNVNPVSDYSFWRIFATYLIEF